MRHASRTSRALAALLLLLLAVPILAGAVRTVVHFATSFDLVSGSPGGSPMFVAEGGVVELVGQVDVFVPTVDATGDGVLSVLPNATPVPAQLDAVLTDPFKGGQVDIAFSLQHTGAWSDLVLSAFDDSDGGMIDVELGDDDNGGGLIEVGGVKIPFPTSSTGIYDVRVSLRSPTVGPTTWTVTIASQSGAEPKSVSASGLLGVPSGKLTLSRAAFTRPAGAVGGTFLVDDLVISTPNPSLVSTY